MLACITGTRLTDADILYTVVTVHHLSDDKRVCAHTRAREGMEVRHVLSLRQHRRCAILVPDLPELCHRAQRFPQGTLCRTAFLRPRPLTRILGTLGLL
jgi:hypothetical protein